MIVSAGLVTIPGALTPLLAAESGPMPRAFDAETVKVQTVGCTRVPGVTGIVLTPVLSPLKSTLVELVVNCAPDG